MPHIHEKYDFVVSAYIVFEDKILLVFHNKLQKWLPIGGHIELDENPEEALYREIFEESGLMEKSLKIFAQKPSVMSPETKFLFTPSFLDVHEITETHRHIGLIYILKSDSDSVILAKGEHKEIRWFTQKETADPKYHITKATLFYINTAFSVVNHCGLI